MTNVEKIVKSKPLPLYKLKAFLEDQAPTPSEVASMATEIMKARKDAKDKTTKKNYPIYGHE